jgi:apolipoprotein N-acyltransferase
LDNQAGKKPGSNQRSLPPPAADVAAFAAGLLLPLAFAPFDLSPLAVGAPALLFLLWRDASPGRAALRGLVFGLGMFGLGVSWVYVSMHNFGNMPAPLAAFATALFVAGLSAYFALFGWCQARFFRMRGRFHFLLVLPALWVLFEWLRGWLLTGFPWLDLGYSQVDTPLSGYAPWLGVYGVSYFCVLSAGLLAAGADEPKKFIKYILPGLALVWIGGWLAGKVAWVQPVNHPVRVALIQGNVPLADKWRPDNRRAIMARYLALSEAAPKSDLIVWPEAAIPAYLDEVDPDYLESLRRFAQTSKTDFLIGVIERDRDRHHYYNSVISIGPHPGAYRKHHLVPFGEYPPLEPLFGWLMQSLQIPMSDFSAGPADQPPLRAAGQRLGVSVCYEDAFGEEVIRTLPQATLLVNVSEDAWFGDSLAPHQRVQMARMRAIEAGRPMLRAANTGPSVVIGDHGHIIARSPEFRTHVLAAVVQPMQGETPYARFGNLPAVAFMAALVAAGLAIRRRPRINSKVRARRRGRLPRPPAGLF